MLSSSAWGDMGMRLLMHVRAITRNESLGCEKRWRSIGTSWFRGRPSSSELSSRAESSQICRHRSSSPISPFSVSFPYRFRFRPIKRRHIDIHQTSTQKANAASYTCRNRTREMKLGFVMIHTFVRCPQRDGNHSIVSSKLEAREECFKLTAAVVTVNKQPFAWILPRPT